jgi:hypothetical protein
MAHKRGRLPAALTRDRSVSKVYKYRGQVIRTDDPSYCRRKWWIAYGPDGLTPLRWVHANAQYLGRVLEGGTLEYMRYLIDTQTLRGVDKPVIKRKRPARVKAPRVVSDGGRRAHGFTRETNDCTVRAISHTRCISYADAHAICATVFHRPERHGPIGFQMRMRHVDWARVFKTSAKTLDAFALAHPFGHFLVLTRGHATAVCDGVVYDNGPVSGLCHVQGAFEVIA